MPRLPSAFIEGWLKKKKSDSSNGFFSKLKGKQHSPLESKLSIAWNKRWFTLDSESRTFAYSDNEKKKAKQVIPFDDITDFFDCVDENNMASGKWKHKFTVTTKSKDFVLYTRSEAEWKIWVDGFKAVLQPKEEPKKKKKKTKKSKKSKKKQDASLDMDQIFVKRGPRETMRLEPTAPLEMVEMDLPNSRSAHQKNSDANSGMDSISTVKRTRTNLEQFSFQITDRVARELPAAGQEVSMKLRDSDLSKNERATNNSSKYNPASSSSLDSPKGGAAKQPPVEEEPSFEENWDEDFGSIEDITRKPVTLAY